MQNLFFCDFLNAGSRISPVSPPEPTRWRSFVRWRRRAAWCKPSSDDQAHHICTVSSLNVSLFSPHSLISDYAHLFWSRQFLHCRQSCVLSLFLQPLQVPHLWIQYYFFTLVSSLSRITSHAFSFSNQVRVFPKWVGAEPENKLLLKRNIFSIGAEDQDIISTRERKIFRKDNKPARWQGWLQKPEATLLLWHSPPDENVSTFLM